MDNDPFNHDLARNRGFMFIAGFNSLGSSTIYISFEISYYVYDTCWPGYDLHAVQIYVYSKWCWATVGRDLEYWSCREFSLFG